MSKNKHKEDKKADAGPSAGQERFNKLLIAGDYRKARAEAAKALADPATTEQDKTAARELLTRSGVEPVALSVGMLALSVVLVIAALLFF